MRALHLGWLVLLTTLYGCTTKRTEVFLGVMTNLSACDGMTKVKLEVFPERDVIPIHQQQWTLDGANCPVNPGEINLPGSFGVSADDNRRIRVVVTGTTTTGLITRESTISIVKEKVLFARMALVDECKNVTCPAAQTCIEGVCRTTPLSVGGSPPMGMPLTVAPDGQADSQAAFFQQRLLPEITGDNVDDQVKTLTNKVECNSGAAIMPYRFSNPTPPANPPQGYPTLPVTGPGCPAGSFCEEGLCYQIPTASAPGPDASLGLQWHELQLAPGAGMDGGAAPEPGSYPEGNQAVKTQDKVVVWGGRDSGGKPLRSTFELRAAAAGSSVVGLVEDIGTTRAGPAPELGASAFDSDRNRLITYRAYRTQNGLEAVFLEYDVTARTWTEVLPETRPPPREHARLAYDPVRKQTLLFGGTCDSCCESTSCCSSTALCDTWVLTFDTQAMALDGREVTPGTTPPGRRDGALVFHQALGKVVLFGGRRGANDSPCDPTRPSELYCNDTWLWDGTNWASANASFMGNVLDGVLLYDMTKNQALWMNFPANSPANSPSEVYAFDASGWARRASYDAASTPPLAYFSAFHDGATNTIFVLGGTDDSGHVRGLWQVPLP